MARINHPNPTETEDRAVMATLGRLIIDRGMRDLFEVDPAKATKIMALHLTSDQLSRVHDLLALVQNGPDANAKQLKHAIGGFDSVQCPT